MSTVGRGIWQDAIIWKIEQISCMNSHIKLGGQIGYKYQEAELCMAKS